MKRIIVLLSAALVLLLGGCAGAPQAPVAPATREIADGIIEHAASGMQFPLRCGEFARAGVRQYDANGLDVSAAYNLTSPEMAIAITVYVYPSPALRSLGSPQTVIDDARSTLARAEFQRCKNEVSQAHGGAAPKDEFVVPAAASGLAQTGHFARFAYTDLFAGGTRPVESLLYVFCYLGEGWTIKYRITYPAGLDARASVNRFLQAMRWTGKVPRPM